MSTTNIFWQPLTHNRHSMDARQMLILLQRVTFPDSRPNNACLHNMRVLAINIFLLFLLQFWSQCSQAKYTTNLMTMKHPRSAHLHLREKSERWENQHHSAALAANRPAPHKPASACATPGATRPQLKARCSETRFNSWPLVRKAFRLQCTNSIMTTPQVQYEKILARFFRFIAIAKRHRRLLFWPIFIFQN